MSLTRIVQCRVYTTLTTQQKKNPQNPLYTQLGVLTKGTIIEVDCSELGLVTAGGKVVWGRWAQVMNNVENDGCVNA